MKIKYTDIEYCNGKYKLCQMCKRNINLYEKYDGELWYGIPSKNKYNCYKYLKLEK